MRSFRSQSLDHQQEAGDARQAQVKPRLFAVDARLAIEDVEGRPSFSGDFLGNDLP